MVGGQAPSATNAIDMSVIYLPNIQFSHITVDVSTTDSSTSDFYSWAITDLSGNVKCSVTAVNVTAGGASDQSCTQGTVTLANGAYIFAFTGNATTGKDRLQRHRAAAAIERRLKLHQLQRRDHVSDRDSVGRRDVQRLRPPRDYFALRAFEAGYREVLAVAQCEINATSSSIVQAWSAKPASVAGVTRRF